MFGTVTRYLRTKDMVSSVVTMGNHTLSIIQS